jgi:predicted transcriptional regulator
MPNAIPHITDAELEILKRLWKKPGVTIRDLTSCLYGEPTNSLIGTVQKLVQRLEAKDLVERDRSNFAHTFSAKVSQAEVAGLQLDELARKVTGGSLVPFISHLVQAKRLSEREREEIQKLLSEGE